LGNLVKSVKFQLHESFKNPKIVRYSAPFEYGCSGWGYFDLPITVTWQDWVGVKTSTVEFELNFEPEGIEYGFTLTLKLPKEEVDKHLKIGKPKPKKQGV
jgi:transcription initiation factor IIF auxiliary subunit